MTAPPVMLDFAGPRVRTTLTGIVLLIFGLAAVTAACVEYRAATTKRAGLELRLAAVLRRQPHESVNTRASARLGEEAAGIARQLGTPWTAMLTDLEAASRDTKGQIAVLSVEPDYDKHLVRINGESRDLPVALAYLQRLQASRSLRYPMLDSHDVVAEDKEHPVRFAMTAQWRELP
jgi:hypothetical protein